MFAAVTASAALSSPCKGTTDLVASTVSFGEEVVLTRLAGGVAGELPMASTAGGGLDSLSGIMVLNIQRAVVQRVRVVRQFPEEEGSHGMGIRPLSQGTSIGSMRGLALTSVLGNAEWWPRTA